MSKPKGTYATPDMIERAAQECAACASWWANGALGTQPSVSLLADVMARSIADSLDYEYVWCDIWSEAEAQLREGKLPDGWVAQ